MEKIKKMIWVYTTNKTTNYFDDSDGDTKPRSPKFIRFLLVID